MASLEDNVIVHDSDEFHEMHCEQCYEFGEEANAEAFCTICLEFMCKHCLKYHTRQNPQHHVQERATMPQEFCFERCSIHQKYIRFYCTKCESFACLECRKASHNSCSTSINHVSVMAVGIEQSNELKAIFNEIDYISGKLEKSKSHLEDDIKDIARKENIAVIEIKQSSKSREKYFEKQRHACTETFEKYLKDAISVIQEEKEKAENRMIEDQRAQNEKLNNTESYTLDQLNTVSKKQTELRRSLLAEHLFLLDEIRKLACLLKQNVERKQRCKLLFAMKNASVVLKIQKHEMEKLTNEIAAMVRSTLPDQIIADARKYQSSISSFTYGGDSSIETPSKVTRQLRVQKCSNSACGQKGTGKFCQECGHRMVNGNKYDISLLCDGKLDDGQNCGSTLVLGQKFCLKCGKEVDLTVPKLLEDLKMIQTVWKKDHSSDVKMKHISPKTREDDDLYMSRILMMTDDEILKIRLLMNSNDLMSTLNESLKACCTKICFSFDIKHVVLSYDCLNNETINFEIVASWLKKAEDVFQSFLRTLNVKTVKISAKKWFTVRQKMQEINVNNPESVAIFRDSKTHNVSVVGEKELVESLFLTIQHNISS